MRKAEARIDPKAVADKEVRMLRKDIFAQIWVVLAVVLVVMTLYFKAYVKGMIIISILFMMFWYLQPLVFGVTGKTVTTYLSRGQKVPWWKRFPLFFLFIVMLAVLNAGLEAVFSMAFPEESVNIVFVIMWLGFLFLLWVYIFPKEAGKLGIHREKT